MVNDKLLDHKRWKHGRGFSAAGRSDSGCSGCLATLRRGSGGAPSYRSHSVA